MMNVASVIGKGGSLVGATMFSGIGAPEVAMPNWRWAWCAEIEKFPSAVLAERHSQSVNLGDVSCDGFQKKAQDIARPDVIVFGSPCQSYSIAGKRLGLDDPRGNLALVALGIVDRLKPSWFVFENVPGFLSSSEGRDFGLFLRAVDELGYSLAWTVLDAQYFGVAQRRQRVFAVGHIGDWRGPAAVLFEPQGMCGDHPPRRETGERTAPTIASRPTGGGGLGTDFDCDGGLIASTGDISHCLNAGGMGRIDYESETLISHALRGEGFDASEDGTGRGTPLVAGTICKDSFVGGAGGRPEGAAQGHFIPVAFSCKDHGADAMDGEISPSMGTSKEVGALVGSAVRRLTPRECERLQGFPDDYTLITYRGKSAADGPRYKALGNSMAVPVMRWILSRIETVSGGRNAPAA